MKITQEQKKKLHELEIWYTKELSVLHEQRLEIMQRYYEQKNRLQKKDLLKKIQEI